MSKHRASPRRSTGGILLPTAEKREQKLRNLPRFEPHDLLEFLDASNKISAEGILKLRERNDQQLRTLAAALGVSPTNPQYWEKAFFLLAHYSIGIGSMRLRVKKPRGNASTWTMGHELFLMQEVIQFTEQGISDRKAIELIMADSRKRSAFPYRPKRDERLGGGYYRKSRRAEDGRSAASRDARTMAVYRHWQQMKAGPWSSLLGQLTGDASKRVRRKKVRR